MDSVTGLRLRDGASPNVIESSFLRNETGARVENSAPVFSGTQFVGNTRWAIHNATPETSIAATGNWWGHVSGHREILNNPQGQGDAVTEGVDYGNFLNVAPLFNPCLRLVTPVSYFEETSIMLDLSCVNATEYRIVERGGF
jgi:hypothetical protein